MADQDPQLKRLLLPPEETLFEQIVRYGLYVGAVFQIICILSIVVYHGSSSDGIAALKNETALASIQINNAPCLFAPNIQDDPSDIECSENSPQVTPRRPHRPRKQEKKKRR